ncbi:conserved hypothetical protein [Chthoniobacter flavus Ellin428]|uniref:DnaJ homologue subfamily C member 28 conserved domain-containing protein n=1 Tax=Chthoniobacter flavus Ellin428 TaxID=497964 RepID=B4CTN1_9BACT|nr:DUF1992 domain-containing protein [Chthoniobacter flavus]EDY21885.1 conserved hypothetical protein [Chthoniobacter flavus Ellin428]TCO89279.1 uncharacterized protein DUF1992 [Chthoniobacter flavus]
MNWTKLAENRIEEAIASGEFENLPGKGQPLDLAEYFALPAAERAGSMLLKNANVIPPEVQMLKEIGELEEAITRSENAGEEDRLHRTDKAAAATSLARLREQLQEKRVAFSLAMERRRRREPRAVE